MESFEDHSDVSSGIQDVDHQSKQSKKKSSKLVDFVTQPEEQPGTSSKTPKVAPKSAMPAKKDTKKVDSRAKKITEVSDKAKVQQALCKEMLTCEVCHGNDDF